MDVTDSDLHSTIYYILKLNTAVKSFVIHAQEPIIFCNKLIYSFVKLDDFITVYGLCYIVL
jgi:hypothetical protein